MPWNERFMPYPILTTANDDYSSPVFEMVVSSPMRSGEQISIPFKLEISSNALKDLVSKCRAQYVIQTSCVRTAMRDTFSTFREEDTITLPEGDYSESLLLTPYILAVDEISNFQSDEHALEWREYHPEGFEIEEAGILAVGDEVEIVLSNNSIGSVIDLAALPQAEGMFSVELDGEHIVIGMSRETKQRVDTVRRRSERDLAHASLFPALYLHAITYALRSLSEHEDRRWAQTMLRQLEDKGVQADREIIQADSLKYAQLLMDLPLSNHLGAAFMSDIDE